MATTTAANDRAQMKRFVRSKHSGSVSVRRGVVHFSANGRENGAVSFHTHSLTKAQGGFQPPSKTDFDVFLGHRTTHTHYVLTNSGTYVMTKRSCNMSAGTKRKLIRWLADLQADLAPTNSTYHRRFMAEINHICPRAFHIDFVPLGRPLPFPNRAKTVPRVPC